MNNIKEILKEKGMRRVELAYKTGLGITTVHHIITNRHNPKLSSIYLILKVLDKKFEDVFYE